LKRILAQIRPEPVREPLPPMKSYALPPPTPLKGGGRIGSSTKKATGPQIAAASKLFSQK
jgi:hypothetical protein